MSGSNSNNDIGSDIQSLIDKPTSVSAWGALLVGVGVFLEAGAGSSWEQWTINALPVVLSGVTALLATRKRSK